MFKKQAHILSYYIEVKSGKTNGDGSPKDDDYSANIFLLHVKQSKKILLNIYSSPTSLLIIVTPTTADNIECGWVYSLPIKVQ